MHDIEYVSVHILRKQTRTAPEESWVRVVYRVGVPLLRAVDAAVRVIPANIFTKASTPTILTDVPKRVRARVRV